LHTQQRNGVFCAVRADNDVPPTIEELLEAVLSVLSVPRLYNEGQLPLEEILETAVRRMRSWCEIAASMRGREPRNRGTPTIRCCSEDRD
jgi:hypothetical protein